MTRFNVRRAVAATTLGVLAVGGLAACGSDDDGGSTASDSSSDDSSQDGDAEEADPETDEGPAEGDEVEPTAFADMYADAMEQMGSAAVAVDATGAAPVTSEGVISFDPENVQMELTTETAGQSSEVLLVDDVMYVGDGAGGFFSLPLDDPNNPFAKSFSISFDAEANRELFATAANSVVYTGTEDVDGSEVDVYEVEMDALASLEAQGLTELTEAVPDFPETLTYTAAFDDDGNLVQVVTTIPSIAGAPESEQTITYSDFGTDVDVQAPDPSTVQDFPGAPSA
ncbi:hypothetical protein [Nocardioides alkalitolerans]|uniref:hypothetical protein n=1 Tax=Nocardioides alkalitolerans TaxID=281714 RepID=UPI0003FDE99F|nr:hypothetical protein [Nocardioides alkalitolerans]